MPSEYRMKMMEPVCLVVEIGEGKEFTFDVFETERVLTEASKLPSQEARWRKVGEYLEGKFKLPPNSVRENQAVEFHQTVVALYNEAWGNISKKVKGIACSQPPTPEFQETIPIGKMD